MNSKFGFDFSNLRLEKNKMALLYSVPSALPLTLYVMLKKKFFKARYNKVPPVNTMFFDGLGKYAKQVSAGAGNWHTLKLIYNPPKEKPWTVSWLIDGVGFSNANSQAVRNRLKIARSVAEQVKEKNGKCRVLCLACGSGESVLPPFEGEENKDCHLTLLDKDPEAIKFLKSQNLDKSHCCDIEIKHMDLNDYKVEDEKKLYDLVEMIGVLEYIDDETAIKYFKKGLSLLKPGGFFVTSNLKRNLESSFIKWVINWDMIYRTKNDLASLLTGKGEINDFEIISEPLKLHNIVIVKKSCK